MINFLRDNWFLLVFLAICMFGHRFGHGQHEGCGMPGHGRHEESTERDDKAKHHEHAA